MFKCDSREMSGKERVWRERSGKEVLKIVTLTVVKVKQKSKERLQIKGNKMKGHINIEMNARLYIHLCYYTYSKKQLFHLWQWQCFFFFLITKKQTLMRKAAGSYTVSWFSSMTSSHIHNHDDFVSESLKPLREVRVGVYWFYSSPFHHHCQQQYSTYSEQLHSRPMRVCVRVTMVLCYSRLRCPLFTTTICTFAKPPAWSNQKLVSVEAWIYIINL